MPDFLVYLIYGGGVIGISLGVFTYIRPFIRSWRGLFPSASGRDHQVMMMEDALSGVYRRNRDDEEENFRALFTQAPAADERPSMYSRSVASSAHSLLGASDDELGDELEDEEPVIRPPIRTISVAAQDSAPRVVPFQGVPPVETEAPEAIDEEEGVDLLADLADPLIEETEEADDNDLLSLFKEEQEVHTVPAAVRKAIPDVTIDALLRDAREISSLFGNQVRSADDAA